MYVFSQWRHRFITGSSSIQEKDIPTSEFNYDNMVATVMNLFLAGTETSSSTIRYALSILIKNPDIQGGCLFTIFTQDESSLMFIGFKITNVFFALSG